MKLPARIVDLHTHLFNARYVPLASIIANAMGKDKSILADCVARLLEALTESSYPEPKAILKFQDEDQRDAGRLEKLWNITRHELLVATNLYIVTGKDVSALENKLLADSTFDFLRSSELIGILEDLSNIDYSKEGWKIKSSKEYDFITPYQQLDKSINLSGLLDWARLVVKKALRVVTKLMDSDAWHKGENYLEFFLTMLKSEEKILAKLHAGYGKDIPPLQVVHYMMDMQMAYKYYKPPYYLFHSVQVDRMHTLQRTHPAQVFGFSAFDPRRENWLECAENALAKGFLGFKFYPAMGYTPACIKDAKTCNDQVVQERINEFFNFCVKKDVPIFAHCTPDGFQTRHKKGAYAHPKYWAEVLKQWPKLRICFGHAGGGRIENGNLKSPGWMAISDSEWKDKDNFAHIVAELCGIYPNVYCEIGYLTELLKGKSKDENLVLFVTNIERAKKEAEQAQWHYNLMDKMAFGTDWHMPDMIDNTRDYLETFLKLFNQLYDSHLENFFWKNAYQYLNFSCK